MGALPSLSRFELQCLRKLWNRKEGTVRDIHRELEDRGVFVQSRGKKTLKEEMPQAYKDISHVVEVVHQANLARKVARLKPLGVIKG